MISIVFSMLGIPVCLLVAYFGFFSFIYLIGDLETLFTKGLIDDTLIGSLNFTLITLLIFILELCFIRLSNGKISLKEQKKLWIFATGLFSLLFISCLFFVVKDHIFYSSAFALLFLLAFYTLGSWYALTNATRAIKQSVNVMAS